MSNTVNNVLSIARWWLGYSEENSKFKEILDIYNSHKPLARGYKIKLTDSWCDGFVSAVAIKAGAVDIIGTECGVQEHITIFKKLGIWIEDGTVTPIPGDIICYNWDDSTQPNDGHADHIGYVESVLNGTITVIEGNKSEKVDRRSIPVGWGYIRGYARPRYQPETAIPEKDVYALANEVIAGKWGNGDARKQALKNAGYDPAIVQIAVNSFLKPKLKSNDEIAKEVIAGKWGQGTDRKRRLTQAGYNYVDIQLIVNKRLR